MKEENKLIEYAEERRQEYVCARVIL